MPGCFTACHHIFRLSKKGQRADRSIVHCSSPQSRDGQRQDLNLFSLDSKIQGLESCLRGLRAADALEVVCWNPLLFSHFSE